MDFETVKENAENFEAAVYNRFELGIKCGKGATLLDFSGKEYIDFSSGIGVNIFGIADEGWIAAVTAQLKLIQHTCNLYYNEPASALVKLLCEKSGFKRAFLCNSGAEANECAIKVARKYWHDRRGEGKAEIITLKDSFHGRTVTTLSATGQGGMHKHFMPFTEGFLYAAPNDIDDLKSKISAATAAVMIEAVQGEGGVNALDKDYVQKIAELCGERDILLICDEIQCGNGRTGRLFGYMNFEVKPDIVTTAKGLGGGLPIGAALFNEKTEKVLGKGDHGSTFGGNPIAAAGAVEILSRLNDELLSEVIKKSDYMVSKLKKLDEIASVHGMGLMLGASLKTKKARDVAAECITEGLVVLTAKEKLRFLPPLNIRYEEIDLGLEILSKVLSKQQ
jgi:acetylornithine/N-succinyldiaminopimelate aminotransferase